MSKPTYLQSQQELREIQARAELLIFAGLTLEEATAFQGRLQAQSAGTPNANVSIGTQPFRTNQNDAG